MSVSIADAVARAKEIAARLVPVGQGGAAPQVKEERSAFSSAGFNSSSAGFDSGRKRGAADSGDESDSHSKKFVPDSNVSNKLADIAARLNQKLGAPAASPLPSVSAYGVNPGRPTSPNVMQNIMKPKSALGFGVPGLNIGPDSPGLITINTTVPDKFVGMLIGRGGENIVRLQVETQCKIQIVQEPCGAPERPVTIIGMPNSVERARTMLTQQVERAMLANAPVGTCAIGDQLVYEMSVPPSKVGAIIGKGGECIRAFEAKFGVKMHVIQDLPDPNSKILRVQGPKDKVDATINFVDNEIIKKDIRANIIDILEGRAEASSARQQRGGPGGPGGGPGGALAVDDGTLKQTTFSIPNEKSGLLLGNGCQGLKEIAMMTGASVELRANQPDPRMRVFTIVGLVPQIDGAVKNLCHRAGLPIPGPPPASMLQPVSQPPAAASPNDGRNGASPPPPGPPGAPSSYPGGYPQSGFPAPTSTAGYPGYPPASGYPGAPGPYPWAAPGAAPAAPGGGFQPPWQQAGAAADYYSQYYYGQWAAAAQAAAAGAPGGPPTSAAGPPAPNADGAPAAPGSAPAPGAPNAGAPPAASSAPAPTTAAPATSTAASGQPDYTAAWVEYYRRMGMHEYADQVIKASQAAAAAAGGAPATAPGAPGSTAPAPAPTVPNPAAPAASAPAPVPSGAPQMPGAPGAPAADYTYMWQQYYAAQAAAAAAAAAAGGAPAPPAAPPQQPN